MMQRYAVIVIRCATDKII